MSRLDRVPNRLFPLRVASKFQSPANDPDAWARRTAARLRLIHSSFSDQTFEQKKTYLEDELEFALEEAGALDGLQRKALLDKLTGCFPDFMANTPAPQPLAGNETPVSGQVDCLAGLIDQWSTASPEQRQKITETLRAAGVIPPAPAVSSSTAAVGLPQELTSRVKLPARADEFEDLSRGLDQLWKELAAEPEQIEFNRLFKVLGMLSGAMRDLHKFIWEFWRQGAPRELQSVMASGINEPLERAIASYLRGDGQTSSRDLAAEIEKSKRLMLGVCVAVRRGAEEFARGHHRVFSPENIEGAVVVEETSGDASRVRDLARKCWEKYCQLSKHMTADAVDQEFQRVFAGVMAAWLRSRS